MSGALLAGTWEALCAERPLGMSQMERRLQQPSSASKAAALAVAMALVYMKRVFGPIASSVV